MDMQQVQQTLNTFGRRWLPSFLSEADGTGSSTRANVAAIVGFVLGAGTTLVFKIHGPVTVAELNSFLAAAGSFVVVTCPVLYALNVAKNALKDRAPQGEPDQTN